MFRTLTIVAWLVALGVTHAGANRAAAAVIIDFAGVTDGMDMTTQSHGTTAEVAVSYTGDFLGWASAWYPEGDGSTGPAIYGTTANGVGTIIFTAASGYRVQIDSLVMRMGPGAQPSSDGLLEYSLDSGATWTEVATNVAAGNTGLITFSGVEASVVQIRWSDQREGGAGEADAAFDNITYTAVVPEPASAALLTLGGALVLLRRTGTLVGGKGKFQRALPVCRRSTTSH